VTVQVTVNPGLVISPSSLINGVSGTPYTQTFSATGGFPAYTFSLAAGSLPPGLTLAGGVLSGTPTTVGTFNFTIQVTDSASNSATQAFQVTISAPSAIGTPTLGTWGMLLLSGSLLLFGAKAAARRPV
jgi:hypothetical protein